MNLFQADNSPETKETAPILARKLACPHLGSLTSQNLQGLRPKDLKEIMFLAHANPQSFGQYDSPQKFVTALKKAIVEKFGAEHLDKVEHVHLLGCEVGLTNRKGQSFAQAVADELHKQGFKKAVVHAVRNPKDSSFSSMIVKVVHRAGAAGLKISNRNEDGDVIAYEEGKEDRPFLHTHDIRAELNKEQNIFHHRDVVLQSDPSKTEPLAKIAARITKLQSQIETLSKSSNAKPSKKGDKSGILKAVSKAGGKVKDGYHKLELAVRDPLLEIEKKQQEKTVLEKLHRNIRDERVDSWQVHLEPAIAAAKKIHDNFTVSSVVSDGKTVKLLRSFATNNKENRPVERASQLMDAVVIPKVSTPQEDVAPAKPKETYKERFNKKGAAVQAIQGYIAVLRKELSRRCVVSFFGHLARYKLSKFEALERKLTSMGHADEQAWKNEVMAVYDNSSFITWGSSSRAVNLITNILNDNSAQGINAPELAVSDELSSTAKKLQ